MEPTKKQYIEPQIVELGALTNYVQNTTTDYPNWDDLGGACTTQPLCFRAS